MPNQEELIGPDREMEDALRSLRPDKKSATDPFAIAFEAGRQSAARSTRIWKFTGFAACVFACVSLALPMIHRDRSSVPRIAHAAIASSSVEPLSEFSALKLRNTALDRGLDALPRMSSGRAVPIRAGDESKI
jgi:hypothetical protein